VTVRNNFEPRVTRLSARRAECENQAAPIGNAPCQCPPHASNNPCCDLQERAVRAAENPKSKKKTTAGRKSNFDASYRPNSATNIEIPEGIQNIVDNLNDFEQNNEPYIERNFYIKFYKLVKRTFLRPR
jgi:hypothetical protein